MSNIAHSGGFLRAYCDTNRGLFALPGGPVVLRADFGVGIFRGWTIRAVALPEPTKWNRLQKLCGIPMPG